MLNITRGAQQHAQKIVIYGPEGIGKTTFAAQFPDAVFIDTEGGTKGYDVARTERPLSWTALVEQVKEFSKTKPGATLVVDTADWAERLAIDEVCKVNKYTSIESPGWGVGYTKLAETYGRFLDELSNVCDAGINVVLVAHAMMRKFEQPDEAASYDRWELKLQRKVAPLVKEWADALLFINYKTIVEMVGEGKAARGKARGAKRTLFCSHDACWDAKNRWGLPEEVPFEYAQIAPFVHDLRNIAPPQPGSAAIPVAAPTKPTPAPAAEQPAQGNLPELPGNLPEFWNPALQLMSRDRVGMDELRAVIAQLGHFTLDTPPENIAAEYVGGFLVPNWAEFMERIKANRLVDNDPIPFD